MIARKKISAVIFDCDGVMFDSRQANINFYNHLLGHFALPPMAEEMISFVHMQTADESVRHIFRGTPYVEEAQAYRMKMDYSPFINNMIMEPGLMELLRWLSPEFGLAVATNRSNTIGDVLEYHGLEEFFDIVISSMDVHNPKPDPESIFIILDFFEIDAAQSIYIGDSQVDYETAKAANVPFVSYQNENLETPWKIKKLLEVKEILRAFGSNPNT
jgi:phosphoglycolate phosphatase-like HAD superfamily hydrolase